MRRKNISNMFWNGLLKPRNPIAEELHKNKLFKPKIKKDKKSLTGKKINCT
jgi:hypothetical protein